MGPEEIVLIIKVSLSWTSLVFIDCTFPKWGPCFIISRVNLTLFGGILHLECSTELLFQRNQYFSSSTVHSPVLVATHLTFQHRPCILEAVKTTTWKTKKNTLLISLHGSTQLEHYIKLKKLLERFTTNMTKRRVHFVPETTATLVKMMFPDT